MTTQTINSIFKLTGGIGLFLFAMYLLEESLKKLSGRNFKLFLQRITKNRIGAVTGGAIVTAVLQSSSVVSLMVLAFVGAGVFTMKNAMAIILGANLGTTLDSWVVATLGFKMNIEIMAYPVVAVGGLLLILFGKQNIFKYVSYFLLGFGLLFISLSLMQIAMEAEVAVFDFSKYARMPLGVFLLIGFFITILVQSSSVTMALTLTALHVGAINFSSAAAIILGSETGTTIKIILSAMGGNAAKKRVALGNLLFNVFLTVSAFIFLKLILNLVTDFFHITNPLIALVTFSSLINLFSIIIFLPFLTPFEKFLEKFFQDTNNSATAFIPHANIEEPETALDLFRKDTHYFIYNAMLFNLAHFDIDPILFQKHAEFEKLNDRNKITHMTNEVKYEFLKQFQGEMQRFYLDLRTKLQDDQNSRLNQLILSIREVMHSVKSMKDIESNIANLRRSSKDIKFDVFKQQKQQLGSFYKQLQVLLKQEKGVTSEHFKTIFNTIQNNYSSTLSDFYKEAQHAPILDLDMTIVINFNRELFASNKALLLAVKDFALEENQMKDFSELSS